MKRKPYYCFIIIRLSIWESVGGSALTGETSLDAVLREIKEETGLILDAKTGNVCLLTGFRQLLRQKCFDRYSCGKFMGIKLLFWRQLKGCDLSKDVSKNCGLIHLKTKPTQLNS